ncbi:MAG: hypothetical protein Q8P67_17665, partial [archaeon]|nr:hypothetical protein [archaeon]
MQIRSKGGKMRVYLAKAMELLRIEKTVEEAETRSSRRLTLVGRGDCVYRAISVGEMLKRSLSGVSLSIRLLAEEDPSQKSRLPITTV